jgi:arylsulfatase A-like enzyme
MKPNVIIVFGDQWRAQAFGYAGNAGVKTSNIDAFAENSVNFFNAVSGCPVCSPYRASLMTGQYPSTHGVFVNDVCLSTAAPSIADTFSAAGYDTAYIGKWHIDGHGRSNYIPPERRQGFDYWKVLECTHDYNNSLYYAGDSDEKLYWEGYDAIAQTDDAINYISNHDSKKPFFLCLSWGAPHAPYETAPEEFRKLYNQDTIKLRDNVPDKNKQQASKELAGYYAHCSALDVCFGKILQLLKESSLDENTILLFTSDHGDMLGSQGEVKKQRPWDESICVPFLLKVPDVSSCSFDTPIDAPDIMPTLLGLADIPPPDSVEGIDFSDVIRGGKDSSDGAALLSCIHPFGQWTRHLHSGREYRGLHTEKYTYTRDLAGPWLLYDNDADPFQKNNIVEYENYSYVVEELDDLLSKKLEALGDDFLPGDEYIKKWKYKTDENGTVPYAK